MDWLIDLLKPGNYSLASTILLYSFVIFAGIFLGKVKILGVSLGVTFVLFVGILLGHFGYGVEANTLHFLREFGLILFIFSIGMQVGPGFFSSFKEGGIRMNMLAMIGIGLNVVIMLAIYFCQGRRRRHKHRRNGGYHEWCGNKYPRSRCRAANHSSGSLRRL